MIEDKFLKCSYQCDLLFCEADDPSISSEIELGGHTTSKDDSNMTEEGWDELIEDIDEGIECDIQFGDDDDDIVITQLN